MKFAIVYDRLNKWGGAERVLLALHELYPEAELYTSIYHREKADWAKVFPVIYTSFIDKIGYLRDKHEFFSPLMPLTFESFDFDEYDLVISVTSEAAKGIITKPGTLHICYCLTPTRYLWSHYYDYFQGNYFKLITKPIVWYLRKWDKIAAQRPDVIVAISTAVQERIEEYYDRNTEVIYPPVEIEKFQIPPKGNIFSFGQKHSKIQINPRIKFQKSRLKNYYLVVSRLVPYKRVDLVIEAFNQLNYPLVIVGAGSEEKKLKKMAKKNIEFTGFVGENELVYYYRGAKAFIFPQEEDFGITAVEAQAAGCPVIAYKAGGALDTVVDSVTGLYFNKQEVKGIVDAVKRFAKMDFDPEKIRKNAEKFSKDVFKSKFSMLINHYINKNL